MLMMHNTSSQGEGKKQRSSKGRRSEHRSKNAEGKKEKSRMKQERHADHVIRNEFLKEYPTNIIQYE